MASPELLVKVIAELILHPGTISERFGASVKYLDLLRPEDFPSSLRKDWQAIDADLRTAGTVQDTLDRMSDLELIEMARRLWDLQVAAG